MMAANFRTRLCFVIFAALLLSILPAAPAFATSEGANAFPDGWAAKAPR